ncbi:MAG: hypothetical protein VX252_13060, partial [Myxococcota bacterium]|nr:hypothetical protein [Myxococcota bacterium]
EREGPSATSGQSGARSRDLQGFGPVEQGGCSNLHASGRFTDSPDRSRWNPGIGLGLCFPPEAVYCAVYAESF